MKDPTAQTLVLDTAAIALSVLSVSADPFVMLGVVLTVQRVPSQYSKYIWSRFVAASTSPAAAQTSVAETAVVAGGKVLPDPFVPLCTRVQAPVPAGADC